MAATSEAMALETRRAPWWWGLIAGIFNIIIGILLFTIPVKTVFTLVLALGIYWIVSGIFTLVGMFIDHKGWGWKLIMGAISIIAGIVILRYPLMSALTIPSILILLLGIQGIIVGIIGLIMAFKGGGWGAGILGALGIIFGIILVANYANPAFVVTLVWIVAIMAVVGGIVQIVMAFMQRSD
jgi:uncharacterized membrane protein HdeD (DUF308 family)